MPTYSFKAPSGKIVELFYTMDEAPSIGDEVDVVGMKLVRIPDRVQVDAKADKHFTSRSLPRWDANAPRHNSVGQPQFASQKEVDEYTAKSEGSWIYD